MRKRPQVQFHDFVVGETESPRPVPKSFHELVNKALKESPNRGVLESTTGVKDIEKSGCFSIFSKINKENKVPFFPQLSRFRLSSEVCRAGPPSPSLALTRPRKHSKGSRDWEPGFPILSGKVSDRPSLLFQNHRERRPLRKVPRSLPNLDSGSRWTFDQESWSVSRNAKSMVFLWGILFAGNERG